MRVVAAAFGLVAVAVVTLAWLESPDRLTSLEAATIAANAYEDAGVTDAVVDPRPEPGMYTSVSGKDLVPVWKTTATVGEGTVELWLSRIDGESVFLDDRSPDGASQLLTEDQFRRLADHYENPAVGRQVRRNLLITLAAGLVVLIALRLSVLAAPAVARPTGPIDDDQPAGLPSTPRAPDREPAQPDEREHLEAVEDAWDPRRNDEVVASVDDDDDVLAADDGWDLDLDDESNRDDEWAPMWDDDPESTVDDAGDEWEVPWEPEPPAREQRAGRLRARGQPIRAPRNRG